jgi:murein DD-endopeptidase MepM/ murein hydrolase activator NlpD
MVTRTRLFERSRALNAIQVVAALLGVLLVVAAPVYFIATGPRDLELYPDLAQSPYRLPWTEGKTFLCVQSNRAVVSHRGWEEFSYDFAMPVGTDIRAARAGVVTKVVIDNDGHGYHWPNNLVAVQHDDGTMAYYLHLKKDGSYVSVGDAVQQGQVISASGHVGNSTMPHLHFHVTDAGRTSTLRLTFQDVTKDRGIPRMFKWYTSGNTAPPTTP